MTRLWTRLWLAVRINMLTLISRISHWHVDDSLICREFFLQGKRFHPVKFNCVPKQQLLRISLFGGRHAHLTASFDLDDKTQTIILFRIQLLCHLPSDLDTSETCLEQSTYFNVKCLGQQHSHHYQTTMTRLKHRHQGVDRTNNHSLAMHQLDQEKDDLLLR